ncbi:hypothetical protein K501DRAFT_331575 [Backusella circina FSU 941]|nr:hypothetical protein K501DRAFT_331575 [Backusella circina FSU 941]
MKAYFIIWVFFIGFIFASNNDEEQQVDKSRFTQLLSNHLLFDHYDKAFNQLSRKISQQFREALQVKLRHLSENKVHTPVDVQILKRQLRGAVGSFVEDKLPSILTSRYNTTDLQYQLDKIISKHCPSNQHIVSQECLMQHKDLVLAKIEKLTLLEFQNTLKRVNKYDLPRLFEKTRAQIAGIIIHFNQHTMSKDTRLELRVKQKNNNGNISKRLATTTSALWITDEMVHDFIRVANHSDNEEGEENSI